jgi:DNA modification methylase
VKVIEIEIEKLKPYKLNAKKHPKKQLDGIAESIRRFGFTQPIVVDKNNEIIIGHGRLEGAKLAGLKAVPSVVLGSLSPAEIKALRLIDNRIAETGWDQEMLSLDMAEMDFDFEPFGIEFSSLVDAKAQEGNTDPDAAPTPGAAPQSIIGDYWDLGPHRLLCGDSTQALCVSRLLDGINPNLMVTDPPYGVNYDPEWREGADLGVGKRSKGKVQNDDKADWTETYSLFPGNVAYVWHAGRFTDIIAKNLKDCDFELISQIIWVKQHFALSRGDYHWQHEPCWYAVKKGHPHNWQGARDQSTTWDIKNNNSFGNSEPEKTYGHGTQKPIACMERPILNNSKAGDWIYDPFGGSGTTLIAAERNNRKCAIMELDPAYCEMIVQRWEDFTGKKAKKVSK